MPEIQQDFQSLHGQEISLKDVVIKIKSGTSYLYTKRFLIFICAFLGFVLGLIIAFTTRPTYTATYAFVLEDGSKSGSLSQYAGLASLAGIDLGGGSSDIFSADNIVELYKSRTMLEKALLHEVDFNGQRQKLIDRYIDFNELRKKWKKNAQLRGINFNGDPAKFNRQQDSLISDIVVLFNTKLLSVGKPDKKLSIINVSISSKDELFAKMFTETLVANVNEFYIQTKTKKSLQSVSILQHQLDSVRGVLNNSISGVASALDATPNANPAMLSLRVPSQRRQVDVQASTAVYAEIVKNLELSRISLRQETPLIQAVDTPVLPLPKDKVGKIAASVSGLLIGVILSVITLICVKVYRGIMS